MTMFRRTTRRWPRFAAIPSTPSRAPRAAPLLRHVVDPERLPPPERRVSREELLRLRPVTGGPTRPPTPPRRPRTTSENLPPAARAYEPIPFHPKWVVVALLVWATVWFILYVASAALLRP